MLELCCSCGRSSTLGEVGEDGLVVGPGREEVEMGGGEAC
jgi:hypothetical protein